MRSRQSKSSSILSQYFAEIREYPLLTKEEEQSLAMEIKRGDRQALNELVESNLSFVAKVASEFRYLGMPFEDLLNEGNVGLIEAAHRFDASKDTKFISYAIWWIRKSILKALSEQSNVVRMPYSHMKKFKEIRKAEKELRRELGRKPTREEISIHLERSVAKVDKVLQYSVHEMSVDEPVGDDQETRIADMLIDDSGPSPEERIMAREDQDGIGEVFAMLNSQQQAVITYRFGLLGEPALTLQDTGERMGLSRERVRQIEVQAKDRMRRLFRKRRRINADYRPPAGPRRQRRCELEH